MDARAADPIVEAEVARLARWVATLEVAPTIAALRERGQAAVERVARAVVSDLLHEPTLGLRRAGERGSSAVYAQTVRELFGLSA